MFNRVQHRCVVAVVVLIGSAGCGGGESDKKAAALALIVGDWRSPQETVVMSIQADGSYTWGKYQGKFAGLDSQRVSMNIMENGKFAGGMPLMISFAGDTLHLTGPDGSIMPFVRATP